MTAWPDFATLTDVTDYQSGDVETLVRQAQGAIRRYCGWHIAPTITETVVLDGPGGEHLWLPSLHVTAVASVTDEGTALTSEDYDWSTTGFVQRRSGYWSERAGQIEVEFDHGYEAIPDELIGVAVSIAARRGSSPAGVRREAAGQMSREYGTPDLLLHEQAVLDRFKLPPRP